MVNRKNIENVFLKKVTFASNSDSGVHCELLSMWIFYSCYLGSYKSTEPIEPPLSIFTRLFIITTPPNNLGTYVPVAFRCGYSQLL